MVLICAVQRPVALFPFLLFPEVGSNILVRQHPDMRGEVILHCFYLTNIYSLSTVHANKLECYLGGMRAVYQNQVRDMRPKLP